VKFRSKVDAWLGALLLAACGSMLWSAWRLFVADDPGLWISLPLLVAGALFVLWVLATTAYVIGDEHLDVRSGPFRWRIPLREITSIQRTRNPLSSPALSLDRLAISYGRGGSCMISPADQAAFLEVLRSRGVNVPAL
jgi:hypothetical protein